MQTLCFSRYDRLLILLFILTLPILRPWLHGDGYGYYAFARSILFQHDLNFEKDFLKANEDNPHVLEKAFRDNYLTPTGHFANHFTIGPAVMWFPFLITARVGARLYDAFRGTHLAANGFSKPYMVAMAFGTAIYGFLGLWISFRLARKYLQERWAFLATLGMWFASSLAFYMYVDPSFSHAHSAFAAALFVWYWDRTRESRAWIQWLAVGAIAGLMVNIYYPNAVLALLPGFELFTANWRDAHTSALERFNTLLPRYALYAATIFVLFIPALITKRIIYGGYFSLGYKEHWFWYSPAFFKVWFSADHGLFTWTPILIPAVVGIYLVRRCQKGMGNTFVAIFLGYTYFIGCYETWHGLHSYGARYFVSLTILFVVGLAAFLEWLSRVWRERHVAVLAPALVAFLALWNFGLIFQFGAHLIPTIGPISFRDAAYNQVMVVPARAAQSARTFLIRRFAPSEHFDDVQATQLKSQEAGGSR